MVTYKNIYSFDVLGKIKDGNQVYVLDRQNQSVALLNDMDVQSAVKIVNAENRTGRFDFWIVEEVEEMRNE